MRDKIPNDLPGQLNRAIDDHRLLASGDGAVVAVSGGVDSMVLLRLLLLRSRTYKCNLVVAHFNHGLRGPASDGDELFVRQTAKRLGLKFKTGSGDVRALARSRGISVEMAARQLRHEFLASTAKALGIQRVALAHHADDQVELFFLRLLRGTGPDGLCGMKWVSPSPADAQIKLIRPLLAAERHEIEAFAKEQSWPHRQDMTNSDLGFLRNRIRNKLLPLLIDEFQPALRQHVLHLIELLRSESELVSEITHATGSRERTEFAAQHKAVQRRVLRDECHRLGITPEFDLIELLRARPQYRVTLNASQQVWCDDTGQVHVQSSPGAPTGAKPKPLRLLGVHGEAAFNGLTLKWRIRSCRESDLDIAEQKGGLVSFDADKVGQRIVLRHWQPGDRIQPIGLHCSVKLQDLFVNRKIPRAVRSQLLIAQTADCEIFWVEGLRISERFKISAETRRRLDWRWQRPAPAMPRILDATEGETATDH
jgi:tRNA(Ile)-lysidine synthase